MAATGPPVVVNIDAYSDVACPWCYVGKRRLDLAIQKIEAVTRSPETKVVVKWDQIHGARRKIADFISPSFLRLLEFRRRESLVRHPYMIDLKTNAAGEEYLAYNRRRWGSDGWTQSLRRSGAKNGLKFANWQWWPNTLHGHRLILLADKFGKGEEAKQLLLQKTYEEGLNISDLEVLSSVATALALPEGTKYLKSDEGKKEVLDQDRFAKSELGIGSVPYFIIENKFSLSGAQDVDTFESAIRKAVSVRLQQLA